MYVIRKDFFSNKTTKIKQTLTFHEEHLIRKARASQAGVAPTTDGIVDAKKLYLSYHRGRKSVREVVKRVQDKIDASDKSVVKKAISVRMRDGSIVTKEVDVTIVDRVDVINRKQEDRKV